VIYKSKQSYYELFDRAKISWKKTQKTNPKFDKELVKKKTEQINDILFKNKAGREYGEIIVLFLDECHLLQGDLNGYVWGQSKIRIEVPITNEKDRQTYLGALNYQSKEFHVQSHPSGDGKSTVKFIKYLQSKYKNRKIILIWEGASYHKYGEFRDFLLELNGDKKIIGQLLVFYLLPMLPSRIPLKIFGYKLKTF
jgi:hypothetical protein